MKSPCPTASAASTILPRVEVPSSPSSGATPTIVLHLRSPSHPHTTTSGDDGEEACKEDDLRRFIYVSMKEEDEVLQKIGPKPSRGVMEEDGDFLQKIIGLLPYGDCQLRRPHFL